MSATSMRSRFYGLVPELVENDPRVAVVLADIGVAQIAAAIPSGHPRIVNVGIREQLMVSLAAGLAFEGLRPVVHSYAPFVVERPFEQLKIDFGHQDVGGVVVSNGASYDGASMGRTHQSPEDVSVVAALPGWEIHVPGHPDEAETHIRDAAAGEGRVYIRLAEQQNERPLPVAAKGLVPVRSGGPRAPLVIAVGPMLDRLLAATTNMAVTVAYLATVRPLPAAQIAELMTGTELVVVQPYLEGALAGDFAAVIAERPHRLLSIGVPNVEHRHYGTPEEHDRAHGLDVEGIRRRIAAFLGGGM